MSKIFFYGGAIFRCLGDGREQVVQRISDKDQKQLLIDISDWIWKQDQRQNPWWRMLEKIKTTFQADHDSEQCARADHEELLRLRAEKRERQKQEDK